MLVYKDMNGKSFYDGCMVRHPNGRIERVYASVDGGFGFDAANPKWIEMGRAMAGELLYPITADEAEELEIVEGQ